MKRQFQSYFKLKRTFPRINRDYNLKNFKVFSEYYHTTRTGELKLSYISFGLKILFEGCVKGGEQQYKIYVKFIDNIEYNEIKSSTLLLEKIPSLDFLKDLLNKYTLREIIFKSL